MKVKVTEQGIVIPKELLAGLEEVEIFQEENQIIVKPSLKNQNPLEQQNKKDKAELHYDPLNNFIGSVSDGSLAQNIDRELYES
ncbi:hypothetical protein Xen7305DRAFT_00022070 [Xenococcus sp. PCC 7305]|uniref:AbrB/MazE/SpoVT family DNA-binding domain-containing protein n=1 Tax=Xenococcus sp. PCC 7305 TaxID=102125 RepID=UPI0002AC45D1|nr:AbrB/MazE/SpoVT family DNA-binding domain-containing protein [Xenococcus sp. PCC 7305]ELS02493.1 hypothetical protein Xen7305DRAFT_00022070 [Xenococcus sp. PCC 7305]